MTKYKSTPALLKWLQKRSIVAVAYYDNCKEINLDYLIALWVDCDDSSDFAFCYPVLDDHLTVIVIEDDNQQFSPSYKEIAKMISNSFHSKIWAYGEVIQFPKIRLD